MHTTIVHVTVKLASVDAFIVATRKNHEASIQEPENRRFDILQNSDSSNKFVLYEAYATAAGAAAHKETPHYLQWREEIAGMMEKPRKGVNFDGLFPVE